MWLLFPGFRLVSGGAGEAGRREAAAAALVAGTRREAQQDVAAPRQENHQVRAVTLKDVYSSPRVIRLGSFLGRARL